MDLEYRDECVECMDIWGSQCHGHSQEYQKEHLTELEKLTQNICGRGITFYSSDKCAYCDNYSGYGNPLCEKCYVQQAELNEFGATQQRRGRG